MVKLMTTMDDMWKLAEVKAADVLHFVDVDGQEITFEHGGYIHKDAPVIVRFNRVDRADYVEVQEMSIEQAAHFKAIQ